MPEQKNSPGCTAGITRRTFHKAVLGVGAALAVGNVLPGCAGSRDESAGATETVTLHFDLSDHHPDSVHELRVAGDRYRLQSHTAQSLLRLGDPYLGFTHHVPEALLGGEKPHLLYVTSSTARGDCLSVVAFHIPAGSRDKVRSRLAKSGAKSVCASANPACDNQDQIPDQFLTGFDTARAIVMHHPEILSLNSDIAAQVEVHICNSAEVMNLAVSICEQGPGYEKDPAFQDGWCVLVQLTNEDGTPRLDRFGNKMYDYRFSERTGADLKPAVRDVLLRIKNDPELRDKMYAVREHGAAEDGVAGKLSARYRLWRGGGIEVSATNTGYKHNVRFKSPRYTGSGDVRSVSLDIVNMNFIWYGLYLEYLDETGKAIATDVPGSLLAPLSGHDLGLLSWLESETVKLEGVITSPPTLFGVPLLPFPTVVDITLPEGASGVRVMLCGPGAFGKVDYDSSLVLGILLTVIMQYALPGYFIYSGKGINEDGTLWGYFKANPGVLMKVILTAMNALRQVLTPTRAHDSAMKGSIETLIAAMVEEVIILISRGALPKVSEWAAKKKSEEEAEDSIPFAGWVIRIVTLLGTVGDMVATSAEIATNPLVIDNTISFTAPVTVTVNCDPGNYQFPEEATYYELQVVLKEATFPDRPEGFELTQSVRGGRSFQVTLDGVPSTCRADEEIEIWFYSDSNRSWLAGHGKASFSNRPGADGTVRAEVTIEENQVPITAATVYSQHRKLEYLSGRYVWNEDPVTLTPPAIRDTDCAGGLCDLTGISVWVPGGMLGYSWQSGGTHHLKNVNAREADPNPGMKLAASGVGAATPLCYDKTAPYTPANLNGSHFYLDPVDISTDHPSYHLRKLDLDPESGAFKTGASWGRFAMPLDRLAVHPHGFVVGISGANHKMGVLTIPDEPYADDAHANNAVLKLGYGDGERWVRKPQSLTVSRTGAILILQGEVAIAVKAFDPFGNPWPFFRGGTASILPLVEPDAKYVDIAIDDTDLLYVLSYTGTGALRSDYRLDVYDRGGSLVDRTTGVSVSRMTVDKWRRVYTLNQEVMSGSPIVEPTVSVWTPSTPS